MDPTRKKSFWRSRKRFGFLARARTFWGSQIKSHDVNFLGYISSKLKRKTRQPLKYKHKCLQYFDHPLFQDKKKASFCLRLLPTGCMLSLTFTLFCIIINLNTISTKSRVIAAICIEVKIFNNLACSYFTVQFNVWIRVYWKSAMVPKGRWKRGRCQLGVNFSISLLCPLQIYVSISYMMSIQVESVVCFGAEGLIGCANRACYTG